MSGFGIRLARHGLPGALGEPDQLLRLARFRAAHPEVIIGDGGFGTVQALLPEPDGETVITRCTLPAPGSGLEEGPARRVRAVPAVAVARI